MTEYKKQQNIAISQKKFDEAMAQYKANYGSQLRSLQSALQKETDPERRSGIESSIAEIQEKLIIANSLTMYDVEGADPSSGGWHIGMDASEPVEKWLKAIEKTINNRMTKTVTVHANSSAAMQNTGGLGTGGTVTTTEKVKPTTKLEEIQEPSEPAPEPTPTPQAQPQQAPSTRLTTDTTPAEFKPALMEKEKAKTEEEYLGKDRSKWANMSTADKVEGLAGLLGDAGGDIVDIVAAAHGIENGGAERLKKRRDEIKQRREERKKEYQEYLNRVDDINRQIAMHNNNTINNSAMAKFNADNAYRMMDYQARQQAAAQAAAGLYM